MEDRQRKDSLNSKLFIDYRFFKEIFTVTRVIAKIVKKGMDPIPFETYFCDWDD